MELYSCFRPGDLVRAQVIALGDSRSYYLSTAKNDLGVVYAKSASGAAHAPKSHWAVLMNLSKAGLLLLTELGSPPM